MAKSRKQTIEYNRKVFVFPTSSSTTSSKGGAPMPTTPLPKCIVFAATHRSFGSLGCKPWWSWNQVPKYAPRKSRVKSGAEANWDKYRRLVHLGNKDIVHSVWACCSTTPALVVVGDIWRALVSQHRRNWLRMNIAKNIFGEQECQLKSYSQYVDFMPEDPAGIKSLIKTFMGAKNVVFLKAPYSEHSVAAVLKMLDLEQVDERLMTGFIVKERTSNISVGTLTELKPVYMPYEKLQSFLDDEMPQYWTPQNLSKTLASHLQSLIH
ncbi:hypothetical protein HJC23_002030 [Cyclotella cryptica]|uniref:Uncharacterized protein n=1 Tax=Cyclotella cryptica TaxID=29204 RepID=A0ABD3NWQ2_9STRA|eukprot:CCRYP_019436-RA/>CCRYP_019436-RA protein AED:0.03 eAED:0.03 QI:288/1/1/1/0/0/2/519/265